MAVRKLKKAFPLSKVYTLLEPGPVVLLTTKDKGISNVMTMSWHTMMDFAPPLVGCVVSNRNYSFNVLKRTRNCVINIPAAALAKKVVGCGNISGAKIDKLKKFNLTPQDSVIVGAPLIKECYASLECRLVDARMAGKYNFFILKVVKAWIDPSVKNPKTLHHMGRGKFMMAGRVIHIPSKAK